MIKRASLIWIIALALAASPGSAFQEVAPEKQLEVPYVPTRYPVVDEMLGMAAVTKDDILYDLGCGDGRIVVAAARKCGARAVGIDIDPERIAECHEHATEAGVEDKVLFIRGDLFEADFSRATVVSLYLLTSVNLKLRPRLLAELAPGTRIVSHNFAMGDWKPDESSEIDVDGRSHTVYLWTVPANVGGKWTWIMRGPRGAWEMTLDQSFQSAVGSLSLNGSPLAIREIEIRGATVRIVADNTLGPGTSVVFEGKAAGNSLKGTARFTTAAGESAYEWEASRDPLTAKPLDAAPGGSGFSLSGRPKRVSAPAP
jgi:SAM-dependent methyltransferase